MSYRAARLIVASGLALSGSTGAEAQTVVTPLFPGITHIKRTEQYPPFQCPGCPAPTPNPRLARLNILLVDLTSPEVHFKLTPPGENLPVVAPGSTTPNWPVVPFEVLRQRTLDFLNTSHAQAAVNVHFFAPFPVPGGSTQGAYAYVIGLAASRGKVYSGFESPIQSYAIVTNSPGLNIDSSNNASIVHRDPDSADGMDVLEDVELWNALAGSSQILTNGVKTIPEYTDATHPDELLTPGPVPPLGPLPLTYTRAGRHWYDLSNARTAIGVTEDGRTLVLFTVDGTNGGHGMQVGEVADLLKNDYGVWNALNLDGGGSTTMAVEDPVTHVRKLVNVPAENPPRLEASNFAVYSDAVDPVTRATVDPPPHANGWNQAAVSVSLEATDLASGLNDTPAGWVDLLRYSLAGAQTGGETVVPGYSASFGVDPEGVTTVSYDIRIVQLMLGHASIQQTHRYLNVIGVYCIQYAIRPDPSRPAPSPCNRAGPLDDPLRHPAAGCARQRGRPRARTRDQPHAPAGSPVRAGTRGSRGLAPAPRLLRVAARREGCARGLPAACHVGGTGAPHGRESDCRRHSGAGPAEPRVPRRGRSDRGGRSRSGMARTTRIALQE